MRYLAACCVATLVIGLLIALLARDHDGSVMPLDASDTGGTDLTDIEPGVHWVDDDCWFDAGWWRRTRCGWLYPRIRDAAGAAAALPVVVLPNAPFGRSERATIYVMGGPGGNSYLYDEAIDGWRDWQDRLGLDHDLVLYDQRGTGAAWPRLQCDELLELDRRHLDSTLDDDALWAEYESALLQCAERIPAADRRAGLYSTRTAAADLRDLIEVLRRAHGYRSISVYGASYGTRLAIEALSSSNDAGVDAVVLDSVYPAGVDLNLAFADSFAAILDRLSERCRADAACAPEGALREQLARALARTEQAAVTVTIDAEWLDAPQPVRIGPVTLLGLVEHVLYADADAAQLPQRIAEAAAGEFGDAWQTIIEDWLWAWLDPEFSMLTHTLIECRDNRRADPLAYQAVLARHPQWQSALYSAADSFTLCDRLGVPAEPLPPRRLAQPALLLAADLDPRTPADIALPALADFPSLQTLQLPIAGHSVVDYDDCAAAAAGRFLNSGGRYRVPGCRSSGSR